MLKLGFLLLFLALNYGAYFLGAKNNMGVDVQQFLLNFVYKNQISIEDKLTEEQKILLAEHLPKLFGVDYLCRLIKTDGTSTGLAPGRWIEGKENDRILCPHNIQATLTEGTKVRILRRSEPWLQLESGGAQINFAQNSVVLESEKFTVRSVGESQANLIWFGTFPQNTFFSCVVGQVQNQVLNPVDAREVPNDIYLGSTTCQMNTQFVDSEPSLIVGDQYFGLVEILKPKATRTILSAAAITPILDKRHKMYQPLLDAKITGSGSNFQLHWTTFRSGKKSCLLKKLVASTGAEKVMDFTSDQLNGEIPIANSSTSPKDFFVLTCKVGIERLYTKKIGASM